MKKLNSERMFIQNSKNQEVCIEEHFLLYKMHRIQELTKRIKEIL